MLRTIALSLMMMATAANAVPRASAPAKAQWDPDASRETTARASRNEGVSRETRWGNSGLRRESAAGKRNWDIRDTLTQVTDGAQIIGTYDYDAQLQRVKADTQDGHVEYVLDGQYVLQETGARTRRYHFGEGNGLAVTDASGSRWLLNDAQGSSSTEVGAAITQRKYDAWGNYRGGTTPSASEPRLGYTGHQYDLETGLTYARARYYDSVNGVFLSQDSVEGSLSDAPSLHRFAYTHNNPIRYTDPSGHCYIFGSGPGSGWSWSACRESAKALAGYTVGIGSAVIGAGVGIVDAASGGAISHTIEDAQHMGGDPAWRAHELQKKAEAQERFLRHPIASAHAWADDLNKRTVKFLDSGDPYELAKPVGEAVGTVSVAVAGGAEGEAVGTTAEATEMAAAEGEGATSGSKVSEVRMGESAEAASAEVTATREAGGRSTSPESVVSGAGTPEEIPHTKVGRWMSPDELAAMKKQGTVQEGGGGLHRVAVPADPTAYAAAPPGDVYATYEVPTASLAPAGQDNWRAIPGPNSIYARRALKMGQPAPELPAFRNLAVEQTKE